MNRLLRYLGIPDFVAAGWLVKPLINLRTGGTCVPCTECSEDCDSQRQCLENEYRSYPRGEYHWVRKNGNTYAGTVARACCGKIDIPGGIDKAWGWNDTPSPGVFHVGPGLVHDVLPAIVRLIEFVKNQANI
ncbi:MAG: hypothetical protein KDB03_24725 [Planctomycetales bacterium]|nr:hypothetical protein [Planctomycetales bacterium]